MFEILGVPAADIATVKQGAADRLRFMFGRGPDDEQVAIATGMAAFWRYCEALAEDRRATPRDDFTSDLVHAPDHTGLPLTQQEVSTILFGLLLAGHETSTNLLGNALRRLLEDESAGRRSSPIRRTIPNAVEEVLRFDSSVVHWRRRTTGPGRRSAASSCRPAPTCSCASAPPTATRTSSPSPTCSTCTAPTPRDDLSFGSASTCASARRWPASKAVSCWRSWRPRCRACAWAPIRSSSSPRSSASGDPGRCTSSGEPASGLVSSDGQSKIASAFVETWVTPQCGQRTEFPFSTER